jgi:hypothetical protein
MEDVRKRYLRGELYWAADLMVELEERQRGKTPDWAIECIRALIEKTAPPNELHLLTWLSDLASCIKKELVILLL